MSSEPIEIALPSDQTYFPGLLVTVFSIAKNARRNAELSFNILDGGIEDDSFALLHRAVTKVHPNTSFRRFKIAERDFSSFPAWKGNRMTYVRYLLPELLTDSHFVVYADSDCLWLADIADLWEYRDKNVILHGVYDSHGEKRERPWFESRGLEFSGNRYFCNGLLLINLDMFREERIIEKCTKFVNSHQDIQFADQSAFNHVIGNRVVLLPSNYNLFTREISRTRVYTPVVLHYANDLPWRDPYLPTVFLPDYKHIWFQHYAEAVGDRIGFIGRQFGYKYRRGLHPLISYALPRDWARHILFGLLLVFGMRSIIDDLRHYSARCGIIDKS